MSCLAARCIKKTQFFNLKIGNFVHVTGDGIAKQVRQSSGPAVYPHIPILHVARAHARVDRAMARSPSRATQPIRPILGFSGSFWGNNVPQNGKFPAQDADEPPSKFDPASFIFGKEIHNHTKTHKNKQTNKQ